MIRITDFTDKTRNIYKNAKKTKSTLDYLGFIDILFESDFPKEDVVAFVSKDFKGDELALYKIYIDDVFDNFIV